MVKFKLIGKPYDIVTCGTDATLVFKGGEIDITGQRVETFRASPIWAEIVNNPKTKTVKKAKGGKKK